MKWEQSITVHAATQAVQKEAAIIAYGPNSQASRALKEAALALNYVNAEDFDRIVDPRRMIHPDGGDA